MFYFTAQYYLKSEGARAKRTLDLAMASANMVELEKKVAEHHGVDRSEVHVYNAPTRQATEAEVAS